MRPPFIFLPADILDGDLTLIETRVLIALYSFRSKNSDTVWPKREDIAERAGYESVATISRAVTSLSKKGWLKTTRHLGPSEYQLTIPDVTETDTNSDLFGHQQVTESVTPTPIKRNIFNKPMPDQVTAYAESIGFALDGQQFCDYYESKGWLIGKTPMKDWKAAVRTWKRNHQPSSNDQVVDLTLTRRGI